MAYHAAAGTGGDTSTHKANAGNENATDTFTLLLFASASSYAQDTETLQLRAPMRLAELFDELERRWPGMKRKVLRAAAVSVNLEYVDFEVGSDGGVVEAAGETEGKVVWLRKGDEVAVVPPVSSG